MESLTSSAGLQSIPSSLDEGGVLVGYLNLVSTLIFSGKILPIHMSLPMGFSSVWKRRTSFTMGVLVRGGGNIARWIYVDNIGMF